MMIMEESDVVLGEEVVEDSEVLVEDREGVGGGVSQAKAIDPFITASEVLSSSRLLGLFASLCLGGHVSELSRKSGLPLSTTLRILKKLEGVGVVEVVRGLDRRKKFYRLTKLGEEVVKHVRRVITNSVNGEKESQYIYVREVDFNKLAKDLGINVSLLAALLNASKIERRGLSFSDGAYYKWVLPT